MCIRLAPLGLHSHFIILTGKIPFQLLRTYTNTGDHGSEAVICGNFTCILLLTHVILIHVIFAATFELFFIMSNFTCSPNVHAK